MEQVLFNVRRNDIALNSSLHDRIIVEVEYSIVKRTILKSKKFPIVISSRFEMNMALVEMLQLNRGRLDVLTSNSHIEMPLTS